MCFVAPLVLFIILLLTQFIQLHLYIYILEGSFFLYYYFCSAFTMVIFSTQFNVLHIYLIFFRLLFSCLHLSPFVFLSFLPPLFSFISLNFIHLLINVYGFMFVFSNMYTQLFVFHDVHFNRMVLCISFDSNSQGLEILLKSLDASFRKSV